MNCEPKRKIVTTIRQNMTDPKFRSILMPWSYVRPGTLNLWRPEWPESIIPDDER